MSNEFAISAVTLALRNFLSDGVNFNGPEFTANPKPLLISKELTITMLPLQKVRERIPAENVVNLSLFRVDVNAAWRNLALPGPTGESAPPPLALNLEYLVTAYGEDDREEVSHYLLGQAMRVFHDHAVIPRARLAAALGIAHVHEQIESIRITPYELSIDDISKLWTVFQTRYQSSAAYLVTVALIDSRTPVRSALPVLTRGKDDRGIDAVASAPPSLEGAKAASGFNAVVIGEDLVVTGERLDAGGAVARVRHPLLPRPADLPVTPLDASALKVRITPAPQFVPPDPPITGAAAAWPAGIYSLALVLQRPDGTEWTTNDVPFALAPTITLDPTTINPPGTFDVTITATPQVRDGQPVLVIWDGVSIVPTSVTTPPDDANAVTTVLFEVDGTLGMHRVRLRVGGIETILMKRTGDVLAFDDAQSVQVKP